MVQGGTAMSKIRIDYKKVLHLLSIPIFLVVVISGCVRCSDNAKAKQNAPETQAAAVQISPDSTVLHYWDNFNFADTTVLASGVAEQVLADYLYILPHASIGTVRTSIGGIIDKAADNQDVYDWFAAHLDRYLYDPNSPYRNEELYAVVLEHIINSDKVDALYKIRPRSRMEDINNNRAGTIAADFTYTLADGTTGRLHGIRADYTLLFFYNPGCSDCKRVKEILEHSPQVTGLSDSGRLRILAFYTDEDLSEWKAYVPNIPEKWINAYDGTQAIHKDRLYAIRAIPTLYLLDRDKRVVLKDCPVEQLEHVLEALP